METRRFETLVAWVEHQGGSLHPSVEVYNDPTTGFSLRVKPSDATSQGDGSGEVHFDAANPIVSCPFSATLSMLNTLGDGPTRFDRRPEPGNKLPLEKSFGQRFHAECPPHVAGRFFLIKQYLLGKSSHWYPYIACLPQPEDTEAWALPAFWPQEDIDLLEGTNAHNAILEIQQNFTEEFAKAIKILKEDEPVDWREYTRHLYNWAYCIFTSRSFRPSLVLSDAQKQEMMSRLGSEEQVDIDTFSILLPLYDVGNHSMLAKQTSWDRHTDAKRVAFLSKDTYLPGQQIFNNYGIKTNSELLLAYGFITPETEELHNDYVHFRKKGSPGEKPLEFLVSLRPFDHLSSITGQARQAASRISNERLRPEFRFFEPALLLDLCLALATDEQKSALGVTTDSDGEAKTRALSAVFGENPAAKFEDLSERAHGALLEKLVMDYTKFLENDVEVDPEDVPDLTRNQRLALQYRSQYGKVFRNAITVLGGEFAEE